MREDQEDDGDLGKAGSDELAALEPGLDDHLDNQQRQPADVDQVAATECASVASVLQP